MKQIFSVLSVTCVAFFTLFLSTTNVSCKKGDTGPKGDTGVANAIYSDWKTFTFSGGVVRPGDTFAFATIPAPKITKEVLDKAEIKVYANLNTAAAPNIVPIPYFDLVYGFWINIDYIEVGKINLVSDINASSIPFRYIIVNPTISANGRAATNNINWNDYKDVQAKLGLKD